MITFTEAQIIGWLLALLLPLFRLLGLFSSAPLLSSRSIPVRYRVVAALSLSLLAAPIVHGNTPNLDDPNLFLVLANEVLTGLAIGLISRVLLVSMEMAGEIIGLQMGLSFASFFDSSTNNNANAIGRLFNAISLACFATLNGPLLLIATTMKSIEVLPSGIDARQFLGRIDIAAVLSQIFQLGLLMALPYMALLLFINLSLGLISRIAPQINIFAIGFPITISAGLLLLTLNLPALSQPIAELHQTLFSILGF
ncbi:MAG: flagellar biosynthetic protein FliR [Lautropia sp.]|nr:flagellar biosynthetic protein FliR [Lautropia sp.]